MLFLLNDRVLDLGDPVEALRASGMGERALGLREAVARGQEAAFASANFTSGHPDLARAVAAMVALTGEANCALFLAGSQARSAREVGVKIAAAPIATLAYLKQVQDQGPLTPALVNAEVWLAQRIGAA